MVTGLRSDNCWHIKRGMVNREKIILDLVNIIGKINLSHPVRVAIDGVDASGKTKLANELVKPLQSKGCNVIRVSVDGFHNPREIRYSKGRSSPQGYYQDSFNNDAIVSNVLKPLGPGGNLKYKSAIFDFIENSMLIAPFKKAKIDSTLLFEGVFLHNPVLAKYWDFTIFVHASFNVITKRAQERDRYLYEDADKIREVYETRYIPGQEIYLRSEFPSEKANVIFDNNDIENPKLIIN